MRDLIPIHGFHQKLGLGWLGHLYCIASGAALPPGGSVVICPKQGNVSPIFWSYSKGFMIHPTPYTPALQKKTRMKSCGILQWILYPCQDILKNAFAEWLSKTVWTTATRLSWSKSNKKKLHQVINHGMRILGGSFPRWVLRKASCRKWMESRILSPSWCRNLSLVILEIPFHTESGL